MQFIVAAFENLRQSLTRPQDATIAIAVRHAVSSKMLAKAFHLKPLAVANHGHRKREEEHIANRDRPPPYGVRSWSGLKVPLASFVLTPHGHHSKGANVNES